MALELSILYRGPLSSCNYDCHYCPFAKHRETPAELEDDRQKLARFSSWVSARGGDRLSVFFTPWGEGMTRRWYRDTIAEFSHLPQIRRVAIQTNLAWNTKWIASCDLQRLGLWCTWHPDQVSRERFLEKCRQLDEYGVRYSVGMVGLKENLEAAQRLRAELDDGVYLWVNAYKDELNYYDESDVEDWSALDPNFSINLRTYPSLGRECRTGDSVISVDGDGTMRRCHFIKAPIGNLYDDDFESALKPRACTNETCSCHIGYVHMPELDLYSLFGDGVLERIPATFALNAS